jgi:hypothetical protein
MIRGQKPNGYFVTTDADGKKIEGETRQCVHCQFQWIYRPGSGDRRGYCLKCGGFVCARPECIAQQIRLTGNAADCVSFYDWNSRLEDKVRKLLPLDPALTVTPEGLIVPRGA